MKDSNAEQVQKIQVKSWRWQRKIIAKTGTTTPTPTPTPLKNILKMQKNFPQKKILSIRQKILLQRWIKLHKILICIMLKTTTTIVAMLFSLLNAMFKWVQLLFLCFIFATSWAGLIYSRYPIRIVWLRGSKNKYVERSC